MNRIVLSEDLLKELLLVLHGSDIDLSAVRSLLMLCPSQDRLRVLAMHLNLAKIRNIDYILGFHHTHSTESTPAQLEPNTLLVKIEQAEPRRKLEQEQKSLGYEVVLLEDGQEEPDDKRLIVFTKRELDFQIKSYGQMDPYAISSLCHRLEKLGSDKVGYYYLLEGVSKEKQRNINKGFYEKLRQMADEKEGVQWDKEEQGRLVDKIIKLGGPESQDKGEEVLYQLENVLERVILQKDQQQEALLEEVLVGMMGHPLESFRDKSVVLLNGLYDEVDWQVKYSMNPKIRQVGDSFEVEYLVSREELERVDQVVLMVAPQAESNSRRVVQWHSISTSPFQEHYILLHCKLGHFTRCGYFDWKVVGIKQDGQIKSINKIYDAELINKSMKNIHEVQQTKKVQGRYIVHPKDSSSLQIHEVFVDHCQGKAGETTQRGDFLKAAQEVEDYAQQGINCLYLMGALQRDNQETIDEQGRPRFAKKEAAPLACTERDALNRMLGGDYGFSQLLDQSKRHGVKVVVDALARVSSSRAHRRYRNQGVYYLDSHALTQICYGGDGRSNDFDDTLMLNYRRKSNWDLLEKDLLTLCAKHPVDGLHLDNADTWPALLALDQDEMYRLDSDGQPAYTSQEIMDGLIVKLDQQSGYYSSASRQRYPNPFLIRLSKSLWQSHPQMLLLAEMWGAVGQEDNRQLALIRSGVIPREYQLPIILSSIFGQQLHRDGSVTPCEKKDVNTFKSYYKQSRAQWPDGSLVVQSSSSHCWPYPALLYKRGAWPAVDVLFFLCDIPMTFLSETKGIAYRPKTTNIFTTVRNNIVPGVVSGSNTTINTLDEPQSGYQLGVMKYKLELDQVTSQSVSRVDSGLVERRGYTGQLVRLASGVSLSQTKRNQIESSQEKLNKELGPEYGFDLRRINEHYYHRRLLRQHKEVFTKGEFIELQGEHDHGWHKQVLVFGRHYKEYIGVVAINFNDSPVHCYLNLQNLKFLFENSDSPSLVLQMSDWSGWQPGSQDKDMSHYFISELVNEKQYCYLKPYSSQVWGIAILEDQPSARRLAMEQSIQRLKAKIKRKEVLQANEIARMLVKLVDHTGDLQTFVNGFSWYYQNILQKHQLDFINLVVQVKQVKESLVTGGRLYAFFALMKEQQEISHVPGYCLVDQVIKINQLGRIAFVCPELGRWSTAGGLGVMVNELSEGMAAQGQNVSVVTPYYDKNRKGISNYLAHDREANFQQVLTLSVWVGGVKYSLGVHQGKVKGVTLYFLHNQEVFPHIYADGDAQFGVKQMAVFAKGVLELFCQLRDLPSLVITNDWFTGLVPAYAKNKSFGDVFNQTKFFHIIHNLDPLYEGRLYLSPHENNLEWLHELPGEWLIDPFWQKRVINPSRCALLTTDNWGTVSQSYRQDLLFNSPLSSLLAKFGKSFAFPNGINKQQRLLRLKEVCGSHHEAKKRLQQKYFHFQDMDDSICLMAFVGRITQQKGVHLILESMDTLVQKYHGKIQVLVGGMANPKDPYGAYCMDLINLLRCRYPLLFWADPHSFFSDGPLVNLGADYGLMPSLFEPCGIVQQEFFVAGTPVIAYKTGGLKDTVHEYDHSSSKGNGFHFEAHKSHDLVMAIRRAVSTFQNKQRYFCLRENAFQSVIDLEEVSKAWLRQFYSESNRLYVDDDIVADMKDSIVCNYSSTQVQPTSLEIEAKPARLKDPVQRKNSFYERLLRAKNRQNLRKHSIVYETQKHPRPKNVNVVGSWDDWSKEYSLNYDHYHQHYTSTLLLKPGEYFYKFVVDGEWSCSEHHAKNNDIFGNINNYVVLR